MTLPSGAVVTCPVLVGRVSVIAALRQALDDAHERRRVVLLSGEAGIGKSRVIEEAKRYAVERRFLVVEGVCFPQDRNCPYAPLLEMIRAFGRTPATGEIGPDRAISPRIATAPSRCVSNHRRRTPECAA